jgi:hypothetical protein
VLSYGKTVIVGRHAVADHRIELAPCRPCNSRRSCKSPRNEKGTLRGIAEALNARVMFLNHGLGGSSDVERAWTRVKLAGLTRWIGDLRIDPFVALRRKLRRRGDAGRCALCRKRRRRMRPAPDVH